MADEIENIGGEVVEEEPKPYVRTRRPGRPRKTTEEMLERAKQLRDSDDARIVDYAMHHGGSLYEQKAGDILEGAVTSVMFNESTGKSRWIDEKGHYRTPVTYDTPEQLVDAIIRWENFVLAKIQHGDKIIPDAEFLATGLGVSLKTIRGWREGKRGDAFREIIENELNSIASVKNQMAMQGGIHPVVWATMMNNIHGYTQSQKVEIDVSTRAIPSKEELLKKVKLLP